MSLRLVWIDWGWFGLLRTVIRDGIKGKWINGRWVD